MSTLKEVLDLAAIGLKVFPIPVGTKIPTLKAWPERATTDEAQIRKWWTSAIGEEENHNVGIHCDGLLVVDIDAKGDREPLDVLMEFEKKYGAGPTVMTPSGGYHKYFRLPDGVRVGNTGGKLAKNIDTRSTGGQVLGHTSSVNGKRYEWIESSDGNFIPKSVNDLPPAPQEIIDLCDPPREQAPVDPNTKWDEPESIKWAEHYLTHEAPPSIYKQHGNDNAYVVACWLRQNAISENAALVMMLGDWNQRCEPPWSVEELEKIVASAYQHAQNAPMPRGAEFDAVEGPRQSAAPKGCPVFSLEGPIDATLIPKREWLVEGVFARGFVTLINAPPGSGKTQWLAQLLLSVVHNRPDVGGFPVIEPTRAWSFNAEDDLNELRRRIAGTIIHYKLETSAFGFALSSGIEDEFCVAKWDASKQAVIRNEKAIKAFTNQIIENKVGLVILDPMADLHEVPESSNDAIKAVLRIFTKIAIDAHCAIGIATHARKLQGASAEGHAGNADSVRGGGAQVAKARIVKSLMPMTEKECKASRVNPENRGSYLRIDTAKNNLGPTDRGARPTWFKWENVPLANGDKVGVLVLAEIVTTRLRQEIDKTEFLAAAIGSLPDAAIGVSWTKAVLPEFTKRAEMSVAAAKKWFGTLDQQTETTLGVITKIDKAGAGGSLLKLTPREMEDDEDVWN